MKINFIEQKISLQNRRLVGMSKENLRVGILFAKNGDRREQHGLCALVAEIRSRDNYHHKKFSTTRIFIRYSIQRVENLQQKTPD